MGPMYLVQERLEGTYGSLCALLHAQQTAEEHCSILFLLLDGKVRIQALLRSLNSSFHHFAVF
jgi:hypothetical protein